MSVARSLGEWASTREQAFSQARKRGNKARRRASLGLRAGKSSISVNELAAVFYRESLEVAAHRARVRLESVGGRSAFAGPSWGY